MNRIFALLALAVLIGFLGIVAWYVPETDLIVVFAVVAIMAICDFWKTILPSRNSP